MELKYIGFFILIIILLIYFLYNRSFTESFSNINVNYNRLYNYVPKNTKTQDDGKYFLFATNKSMMSGVNPLIFGTYTDYLTWYNTNTSDTLGNNILKPIFTDKNQKELIEGFKKEGFKINGAIGFDENHQLILKPEESKRYAKSGALICPKCKKGEVIKGSSSYGCSAYKDGCDYRYTFDAIRSNASGKTMTKELVEELLIKGM